MLNDQTGFKGFVKKKLKKKIGQQQNWEKKIGRKKLAKQII